MAIPFTANITESPVPCALYSSLNTSTLTLESKNYTARKQAICHTLSLPTMLAFWARPISLYFAHRLPYHYLKSHYCICFYSLLWQLILGIDDLPSANVASDVLLKSFPSHLQPRPSSLTILCHGGKKTEH